MLEGIVLAAGLSRRFASRKLIHPVAGHPLIHYCLKNVLATDLARVLVVVDDSTGPVARLIDGDFGGEDRLDPVVNDYPGRGQMSSLKLALAQIGEDATAAIVFLADMPLVKPEITRELVGTHASLGGIVVPVCDGMRRHPRIIPRALFAEFMQLGDDHRGEVVIGRHLEDLHEVDVGEADDFLDVDSAADLERVESILSRAGQSS